jgi:hypothetical protein
MNWGRKETRVGDDARDQLVPEPVRANPHGQYDYRYSSDEEDRAKVIGNNSYDQDYCMKVKIFFMVI